MHMLVIRPCWIPILRYHVVAVCRTPGESDVDMTRLQTRLDWLTQRVSIPLDQVHTNNLTNQLRPYLVVRTLHQVLLQVHRVLGAQDGIESKV